MLARESSGSWCKLLRRNIRDGHVDHTPQPASETRLTQLQPTRRRDSSESVMRAIALWSGAICGLVGAAIEHAHLFFRDGIVEGERLGLEVALRHILRLEVAVGVFATHKRRPVALAHGLLQSRRDIADRKTNASIVGAIGLRSVEQKHMMQ